MSFPCPNSQFYQGKSSWQKVFYAFTAAML
jgi:hypothetical protein